MNTLIEIDKLWFIKLNSLHTEWLDTVMFYITKTETWIPLYILLLVLIYRNFKKQTWVIILGIGLTILLADQITSNLMKPYFERLRPSHDPSLLNVVHIVRGYKGGLFGFASSHAANTFGIAIFVTLLLKNTYRWIWVLFLWAGIVGFSRIYLGVHFPGDIIFGALVGLLSGYFSLKLATYIRQKYIHSSNSVTL